MSILFALVGFVLSLPLTIGVWVVAVHMFQFIRKHSSGQTAFIATLCVLAGAVSLLTAPVWLLGFKGLLASTLVGVFFVGMGAKHTYRALVFLKRELDTNPDNDVPLPPETTEKK